MVFIYISNAILLGFIIVNKRLICCYLWAFGFNDVQVFYN